MGHTTKSARFSALLGMLVIGGLVGLAGSDSPGGSTPTQDRPAHDAGGVLPLSLANRFTATEVVPELAPISRRADYDKSSPGTPFESGGSQLVLANFAARDPGDLHLLSLNASDNPPHHPSHQADTRRWRESRGITIVLGYPVPEYPRPHRNEDDEWLYHKAVTLELPEPPGKQSF